MERNRISRIKYIYICIYIYFYRDSFIQRRNNGRRLVTRDQSLLPTACVGRRDIAWVIALIPRTRTDIRKYLCREKKKEGRKKKKKGKGKKVETEKPHPTHDIESRRRNPAQSSAIFRPFHPLLRNLGFFFPPSLDFSSFRIRKERNLRFLSFSSKREKGRGSRLSSGRNFGFEEKIFGRNLEEKEGRRKGLVSWIRG